jgi:drug/metabolite transporter (DMT)-like permease
VPRHEFQPGKLIAGLALALAGVVYAGDAGGLWDTPWFAIIPLLTVGLFLAGATSVLTRAVRRRRSPRKVTEPRQDISA